MLHLVKAVLESQVVYWMALTSVPTSILSKIRQLIFYFLWIGGHKNHGINLCNWIQIAKPKRLEGWGLKNPFLFNRVLTTNSPWRVLMEDGIWHRLIIDKYLPYTSMDTWLRFAKVIQPVASHLWKILVKSLPLITHWLIWKPGGGDAILIGLDKILGFGSNSFLSQELLLVLRNHNIHYLYQAKMQS
jgi:hypothetical protein